MENLKISDVGKELFDARNEFIKIVDELNILVFGSKINLLGTLCNNMNS
jgi:hypothetical protein